MKLEKYFYNIIPIIIVSLLFKQYVAPYIVDDESYLVKKFLYNENFGPDLPKLKISARTFQKLKIFMIFMK